MPNNSEIVDEPCVEPKARPKRAHRNKARSRKKDQEQVPPEIAAVDPSDDCGNIYSMNFIIVKHR